MGLLGGEVFHSRGYGPLNILKTSQLNPRYGKVP